MPSARPPVQMRLAGEPFISRGLTADQAAEGLLELYPGQLSTEAVMHAGAEAQVAGCVTGDVEPVRIGEYRRVSVGRGVQRYDLLTCRDHHSADLYVFPGDAGRCHAAQPGAARSSSIAPGINSGSARSVATWPGWSSNRSSDMRGRLARPDLGYSHQGQEFL